MHPARVGLAALVPLNERRFPHQLPDLVSDAVMKRRSKSSPACSKTALTRRWISHRAGRLGFDGRYAAMLLDEGYRVGCSVSRVSTGAEPPAIQGKRGTDYTHFRHEPLLEPYDISAAASAGLLEVPIQSARAACSEGTLVYRIPLLRPDRQQAGVVGAQPFVARQRTSRRNAASRARSEATVRLIRNSRCTHQSSCREAVRLSEWIGYRALVRESGNSVRDFRCCSGVTLKEFHARFSESVRRQRRATWKTVLKWRGPE